MASEPALPGLSGIHLETSPPQWCNPALDHGLDRIHNPVAVSPSGEDVAVEFELRPSRHPRLLTIAPRVLLGVFATLVISGLGVWLSRPAVVGLSVAIGLLLLALVTAIAAWMFWMYRRKVFVRV